VFAARRFKLLIVLLSVAVVVLRIGGTHLHLCYDGSEPPVTLHVADSGVHHDAAAAAPHADRDVSLGAEALVKKSSVTFDLAALAFLFALVLFVLPRLPGALPDFFSAPWLSPARIRLRPPLRGPPR
jgi:hypothetical protein